MRIVFIGCVKSSEMFLEKLIEIKADIVGVVTKKESKYNSDIADIGAICERNRIDYFYTKNSNDEETKAYIAQKRPEVILCLGWSQLLDDEVLKLPTKGCIGFHPAKLPNNRGRHPLIWALALGLTETASTLFKLEPQADRGAIISQERVRIDYEDDAMTLYEKVMEKAVLQLEDVMLNYDNRVNNAHLQKESEGNVWRKRRKMDGQIDWRMSSRNIYNLVRALTKPYVGAHLTYKEKDYKVWKVREIPTQEYLNIEPGRVIEITKRDTIIVKAGENLIEILEMDPIVISKGDYII